MFFVLQNNNFVSNEISEISIEFFRLMWYNTGNILYGGWFYEVHFLFGSCKSSEIHRKTDSTDV